MNFCSQCGSAALSFEVPRGDNRSRYVCGHCGTVHYTNPKIVTGCLPLWDGKVLLARRSIAPRYGFWNVPSGYMENGETVEEGACREVREEVEASVTNIRLHTLYSLPHINQVYIHFLGDLKGPGAFGVGEESLEARLFAEEDVPWEEIAFTSSTFSLRRFFEDQKKGQAQVHIGQLLPPGQK
ncbi:NUDIX hydrolase [Phaeodactylibacter luteus]|uniref:NUDIX hydrolase n=1 Tax=Phaeodactylibacter luteus TaxID=1564516 RepID=A0A5C6RNU5_9BACT|nr:NUDIX hydrolase [Phaeodactylibacter luteus]TXB63585.1 NUDIX hydrolase [Phaeodactylibacter luteus]